MPNPSPSISTSTIEPTTTPKDAPAETLQESPALEGLSLEVRDVMRHIPHSAVVLTTPNLRPEAGEPVGTAGMTLSSFATLTLSPEPIITFNIKRPSRTLDALKALQHPDTIASVPKEMHRRFHIHILQANSLGAGIADRFSRGGPISSEDLTMISKRGGTLNRPEKHPHPFSKGIRRSFECQILQDGKGGFIDVGDHTLVFGKVIKIASKYKPLQLKKEKSWNGLCYLGGRYHTSTVMSSKKEGLSLQKDGLGDEVPTLEVVEGNGELTKDSMLEGKENEVLEEDSMLEVKENEEVEEDSMLEVKENEEVEEGSMLEVKENGELEVDSISEGEENEKLEEDSMLEVKEKNADV
ncbi:hypothetical protein SBOR_2689 [Sclerotinia borealis F-4128]|uniref:Flavin reductase like domain-containing protein n=1 Tax=Sclerotinia borealis (strain F-4128) TaxID=1432307 RepID=W9CQZ8_SCLBF|nr:hypothetical protein SBOR_2689 [Sclerotinia borealis F-4128]